MNGSVMITVGYPHELLGHLRRLEGAGDINFFADSGRLLDEYRKKYSGYGQGVKELETAARLGIITEMVEIYGEPMWRKRAFINKSAIRLMQEPGIKEYEMVELLESFIQLFDWDIEMPLSRRWETTEEDSAEWYKNNSSRKAQGPDKSPNAVIRDNKNNVNTRTSEEPVKDGYEDMQTMYEGNTPQDKADIIDEFMGMAAGQMGAQINAADAVTNAGEAVAKIKENARMGSRARVRRQPEKTRHLYAEEYEVDRIDSMFEWMSTKEFVENEILKSGMRFERLMNNSQRREARRAINGNTDSQCKMGAYYAEPDTKHTDIVEAVKWYKLSASQGNNKAQFELGMLYDKGRIKCDDYKGKAMECYMALAKAGFPSAQCTVGLKYRFGDGVEEDLNEAIKWFKRSANQGHVDAQRNLGDIYAAIGKEPEAERWYRRAAASGDAYSEKKLNK